MSYENLRVYQAATRLRRAVDALCVGVPKRFADDIKHLQKTLGQIEDGISEAYGVEYPGRKKGHLKMARGSADEARGQMNRLADRGAFTPEQIKAPCILARTIAKMLTALIKAVDENEHNPK